MRGFVEVGIVHHDDRVVAAQLQHHAAVAGFDGDVLADGHAAGEGDQVDGLVISLVGDPRGSPVTTLSISGGRPGFVQDVGANSSADSGTFSEGLSTMRLLVATDGTTLCATWFIGWLNGVMALITPSSGRAGADPAGGHAAMSQLKTWPSSFRHSLAPNISTSATRPAS